MLRLVVSRTGCGCGGLEKVCCKGAEWQSHPASLVFAFFGAGSVWPGVADAPGLVWLCSSKGMLQVEPGRSGAAFIVVLGIWPWACPLAPPTTGSPRDLGHVTSVLWASILRLLIGTVA